MAVPPERYHEELTAFQSWMNIARANAGNPVIVRTQVMTELYVAFVWLRDSLLKPLANTSPDPLSALTIVYRFLSDGQRRRLRNTIANGRWCYQTNFAGIDCWDGPPTVTPLTGSPTKLQPSALPLRHRTLDASDRA